MSSYGLLSWAPILILLYTKSFIVDTFIHETAEDRDLCDAPPSEVVLRSLVHGTITFVVLLLFVKRRYAVAILETAGLFAITQLHIHTAPPYRWRGDPFYVKLIKQSYHYLFPFLRQLLYVWLAYILEYSK